MAPLPSQVAAFQPFVLQVTPEDPPTGHSVELIKQEIELYMRRLLTALQTDMARVNTILTACCAAHIDP